MSWTDERVELLKKLWSDGLSASQIAAELGGITRNAVIGKVHRLGLSGRAKSASAMRERWQRQGTASAHMIAIWPCPADSTSFSSPAANSGVCMWSANPRNEALRHPWLGEFGRAWRSPPKAGMCV